MKIPALFAITGSIALATAPWAAAQKPKATPEPPSKTEPRTDPKEAYATVKETKLFAIGGIGVAGTKCTGEVAFRKIIARPDAVSRCQALIKEATPEGKLYGLLGLKLLDAKAYAAAVPDFRNDLTQVDTAGGCMLYKTTVAGITKNIDDQKLK